MAVCQFIWTALVCNLGGLGNNKEMQPKNITKPRFSMSSMNFHLPTKASVHQETSMLATSKNVLFPGHNHLLTTGTDDPSLAGAGR